MKKIFFFLFLATCFNPLLQAQIKPGIPTVPVQGVYLNTHINKVPQKNAAGIVQGVNHVIQRMGNHNNDGRYERAMSQADVIGNDYLSVPRIYGENSNDDNSGTSTDLVPVDGYKRTFCGKLHAYEYHGGLIDQDLNVYLDINPNNELLRTNQHKYDYYKENVAPFFDPWNIIEGEVTIRPGNRDNYPNPTTILRSEVCIYGSWVFEIYKKEGVINKAHDNNNEIHPMEQFWYKDSPIGNGNTSYKLNFFVDGSGKFDKPGDYYNLPSNPSLFKPWSRSPTDGKFYVAFSLNLRKKEQLTYWIEVQSNRGAEATADDGKNSFLIFGRDTLINIFEGSGGKVVTADFENVGYKPLPNNRFDSSIIQGFLVLGSRIKGVGGTIDKQWPVPNDYVTDGDLRLRLERKSIFQAKQTVSMVIESIKRLELNSYRYVDQQTHQLHTDPQPVPPSYNEKSVYLSLGSTDNFGEYEVNSLERGEKISLSTVHSTWSGFLSDKYRFELTCKENYSGKKLGTIVFTGDPLTARSGTEKTVLLYSDPGDNGAQLTGQSGQLPNIQRKIYLFEVTYRIVSMDSKVPGHNFD